MSDVVVSLLDNLQAKMLIKGLGLVVAVDVKEEPAWFGMLLLDKADCGIEERAT